MPKDPRIDLLRSVPLFMDCKSDRWRLLGDRERHGARRAQGPRTATVTAETPMYAVTKRMRAMGTPPAD